MKRKVIAVVRKLGVEDALKLVEVYVKAGVHAVEFAFDQHNLDSWKLTADSISMANAHFGKDIAVGAGTVLNLDQLSVAVDAGAKFIVSPNVNSIIIERTKENKLISIPGAFTPSEIEQAYEIGADYVKIFPADALGPNYFRALMAPFSHIKLLAFGGVTPDNINDYIIAGCAGVGVSGLLADRSRIGAGDFASIAEYAYKLVGDK